MTTESIFVEGVGPVEITNWDTFQADLMFKFKEELVNRIQDKAMQMRLFDGGAFIRGIRAEVGDDTIYFTNDTAYAIYLEYGTYEFGASFGEDDWPPHPFPKKKDLPKKLRDIFPSGMQPFAAYRKVLLNPAVLEDALKKALSPMKRPKVIPPSGIGSRVVKAVKGVKRAISKTKSVIADIEDPTRLVERRLSKTGPAKFASKVQRDAKKLEGQR